MRDDLRLRSQQLSSILDRSRSHVPRLSTRLDAQLGYTEVERRAEDGYRRIYMDKRLPG
jgi:hypothetical protein